MAIFVVYFIVFHIIILFHQLLKCFSNSSKTNAFCSCGWGERSLDWDRGERSLLVDPLADVEGGDFVGAGIVEDDLFRGSLTRNLVAMSEVPS